MKKKVMRFCLSLHPNKITLSKRLAGMQTLEKFFILTIHGQTPTFSSLEEGKVIIFALNSVLLSIFVIDIMSCIVHVTHETSFPGNNNVPKFVKLE